MSQTHAPPRQTTTKLTAAVGILTMLFGALLVFAPGAGAAKNVDKTAPFDVVYNGFSVDDNDTPGDSSDDTTTFEYELTGPAGEAVSHAVFGEFCERPSSLAPGSPVDKTTSADPTTSKFGFKWDGDAANPVGQVYAITFDGVHDGEGTVEWTIKKGSNGGSIKSVTLAGPSCDTTPPCDPQTDPNQCEEPCDPQTDENQCEEPCIENDTRPACSLPPPPTCIGLGNCPPPPTCIELGNCPPPPTCIELGNCPTPVVEPEPAALTIVTVVQNGPDDWAFPFAGDLGRFALTHLDGDQTFADLDADEYEVTQADSGVATLASIECDEDADVTVDLDRATVTVVLAEGDDVTCTFTNVYDVNVLPESPPIAETPLAKPPVVVPAAAPVTPPSEILGATMTRTLPRTGSSTTGTLALAGGALMLLGAALVGGSRRLQTVG